MTVAVDPAVVALATAAQNDLLRQDPLATFTVTGPDGTLCEYQKAALEHLAAGHEVFLCGGNQIGKTILFGAFFVACAQGRPSVAGVRLPIFKQPSVFFVLCHTREQQIEATQATILQHLGDWPHRVVPSRQFPDAAQLIRIKPIGGSNDPKRWSKLWFHVEGSGKATLPGGRLDGGWADEPPWIRLWREIRFRGRDVGTFVTGISATPLEAKTWRPIKKDFEGCDGKVVDGRIRIIGSVMDNPFLSAEKKLELVKKAKNDVHEMARLYGAYVDETGSNPFDRIEGRPLDRWIIRSKPGQMVSRQVWVEVERHDGTRRFPLVLTYEQWWPREEDETYYALADPSLGIDDGKHDPAGLHVYARRRPRLVARWVGYVPPWGLGWFGALMCRDYPDEDGLEAYFDIEDPDGIGAKVVSGARAAGHTHFAYEVHEDRITGIVSTKLGWKTTTANRGAFIGAVQETLMEDSVVVLSRGVCDTLKSVIVDSSGRAEGEEHDEDMILLGRFAHMARVLGVPPPVSRQPKFERLLVQELGEGFAFPRPAEPAEDWGPGM